MSDKEHTASSLGNGIRVAVHSGILCVQHSVGEPIPEFAQRPEEGSKSPSSVLRQDAGDVFPDDPPWAKCLRQSDKLQREAASSVGKPASEAGDGKCLAGSSADEDVDGSRSNRVIWFRETSEVSVVDDMRVSLLEDGRRERLNLTERCRLPAQRMPRDGRGLDARAYGQVLHRPPSFSLRGSSRRYSSTYSSIHAMNLFGLVMRPPRA
jgi:hypothetical protein